MNDFGKPAECQGCAEDAWIGREVIGPVILAHFPGMEVLAAYEHGAEAPDHFLAWFPEEDRIDLRSSREITMVCSLLRSMPPPG